PRPSYIDRTIEGLRTQTLAKANWEMIVVDNASDNALADSLDLSWHSQAGVVAEPSLGLTPARLKGIRESTGEVLVFVDDDNVLDAHYLEKVEEIADRMPHIGSWSGTVVGEFETPPPEWTRRYWGNLVIREAVRDVWSNIPGLDDTTPLGAGLCIRRVVADEYVRLHETGKRSRMLDRAGTGLVSGGDNDLAACAIDIGLGCGLMSSLRLTHLIPPERLTEVYLIRLIEGVAYSSIVLQSFRPQNGRSAGLRGIVGKAADVLRKGRMSARERRFHAAAKRGETRAREELGW
ncbi:MAG: glycosyltransferase, partial [Burkholderiales bacterium]